MSNPRPERILWDRLDQCGIAFRESQGELIARFGQREVIWTDSTWVCEIESAEPFLHHLAGPPRFQFTSPRPQEPGGIHAYVNLKVYSTDLFSYIRQSENAYANFDLAASQLTAMFDKGQDISVSNTIARKWTFGRASVTARAFPRDLDNFNSLGSNNRHRLVPGSATECSIQIDTGYLYQAAEDERVALDTFRGLELPEGAWSSFDGNPAIARDWLPSAADLSGVGVDADDKFVIQVASDKVNFLPVEWLTAVKCDTALPARGPGGEEIRLLYDLYGDPSKNRRSYLLKSDAPGSLVATGRQLAGRLNLKFKVSEYYDD